MKRKICEISGIKMAGDGNGTIEGYASTFGNFDRAKEAVVAGAFKDNLGDFLTDGFAAIGHDWASLSVGTIEEAREDAKGLFVKIAFHSTEEAQNARRVCAERLERGKSVAFSIGYQVEESERASGGTLLTRIKLYEVSIVTVPCNPQALATGAKGYFGETIGQSMTISALARLQDALMWRVYDLLYATETPLSERLEILSDMYSEFGALAVATIGAILRGAGAEDVDTAAAEIKAHWKQPETKDAAAPSAEIEQKLLEARLAILKIQTDRITSGY